MKLAVAGARGLVGSHLVGALRAGSWPLVSADRDPGPADVALDITDAEAVARFLDVHAVTVFVCAAANPSVEGCEKDPRGTRPVNVEAPLAIARRLSGGGGRLVAFSSEYVFDGARRTPYEEQDATRPLNEYGRQKLELEQGLLALGGHLVIRTSAVYGREERRKNFVYQLLDHAARGASFAVPGDQLVTPTAARSLAALTAQAVERGLEGVLHLAGSEVIGRVPFARLACQVFGLDERIVQPTPTARLGLAAVRPSAAGLSVARARQLGLAPLTAPRAGLEALRRELGEPTQSVA